MHEHSSRLFGSRRRRPPSVYLLGSHTAVKMFFSAVRKTPMNGASVNGASFTDGVKDSRGPHHRRPIESFTPSLLLFTSQRYAHTAETHTRSRRTHGRDAHTVETHTRSRRTHGRDAHTVETLSRPDRLTKLSTVLQSIDSWTKGLHIQSFSPSLLQSPSVLH
jgi:hypothetical protein